MSEYAEQFKSLPNYRKKDLIKLLKNPFFWGQAYLQNRDGSDRRFWPHQAEDLQCRDRQIIHRDGRDVGKTVNIATLGLHKAFTSKGGQVLIAAPHQGHLDTIIDEVEWQIDNNPDLSSSIAINNQGRPKILRKPYFRIEWKNGSVIFFRPAGAYGDSFRSLHVDMILVDEGAWIPEKAWKALRQCLKQGGVFRIYSTPNGLRDTTYFRLTSSDRWKLFKIPSWKNPNWTENREIELLEFYGGIDSAGWQHEVAGVHGKPSYGAFNIEHFKLSQVPIDDYQLVEITQDHIRDCENETEVLDRVDMLLNLIPQNNAQYVFWVGSDTGYVNDPTEIVVFREVIKDVRENQSEMELVLRVHCEHIAYPIIAEILATIDRYYKPSGVGLDHGGNGMSILQDLLHLDKFSDLDLDERLEGIDFGSSTIIGYRDDDKTKPLKKRTKEFMTTLIAKYLHSKKLLFPIHDAVIEDQFTTHTYTLKNGRVIYSKGNDHIIDAVRCAMLVREKKQKLEIMMDREIWDIPTPVATNPIF
ncbi:MAG: terminase large subunit domain-containing protein [Fidelibacterota bacterium]